MRRPRGLSGLLPPMGAAGDPGMAGDVSHRTPHPLAPTSPRTPDVVAQAVTDGSPAKDTSAPGSAAHAEQTGLDSYISALMAQQGTRGRGLAGRTGPLPVQFQPTYGGLPLSGGQVFLRNLVGGYNSQAGVAAGGAKAPGLLETLRYQEMLRRDASNEGNRTADNTRADQYLADSEANRKQREKDSQQFHDDLQAQRKAQLGQGQQRITIALGNEGMARTRLGIEQQRFALSQQREARRAQAQAAYMKLPPALRVQVDEAQRLIGNKIAQAKANDTEYDPSDDYDAINAKVMQWSQQAGNPFQDPYIRSADMQNVQGGHSSTAGAASPKASDNPALTKEQRAFYKSQGH